MLHCLESTEMMHLSPQKREQAPECSICCSRSVPPYYSEGESQTAPESVWVRDARAMLGRDITSGWAEEPLLMHDGALLRRLGGGVVLGQT